MRRAQSLTWLVGFLLAVSACSNPPEAPGVVMEARDVFSNATFSLAPGDTLRYTLTWTPGARAQGYLVTTTVTQGSGWTGLLTNAATAATTMPFSPIHLTAWDSVSFSACVVSTAPGKANSSPTCTSWKLIRGPTPPGGVTVDSSLVVAAIILRPDSTGMLTLASKQFCSYAQALDGKVRLLSGYEGLPDCQQHYDTMANTLPGYPVALSREQLWFNVPSAPGVMTVATIRTPQLELAHVIFAGPFTPQGDV